MTITQLATLGADMRAAQRQSFRNRSEGNLERAKLLERRFDKALWECLRQPQLFHPERDEVTP